MIRLLNRFIFFGAPKNDIILIVIYSNKQTRESYPSVRICTATYSNVKGSYVIEAHYDRTQSWTG
jgi:hypothetical protein